MRKSTKALVAGLVLLAGCSGVDTGQGNGQSQQVSTPTPSTPSSRTSAAPSSSAPSTASPPRSSGGPTQSAAASPSDDAPQKSAPTTPSTRTSAVPPEPTPTGAPPATPDRTPGEWAEIVNWQVQQVPAVAGTRQVDRIQTVEAPGPPDRRPSGPVLRFELRPGDVTDTGGFLANRTEVYGRAASPLSAPPDAWPDPVGSVRWYQMSIFVPNDFSLSADATWLTIAQWKGLRGGSPPIALEIKRDSLRLGGARTNSGFIARDGYLGTLPRGVWFTVSVGIGFSPDPNKGWVEVWRDGEMTLPRTSVATMDLVTGQVDPTYLKQGLYRDPKWAATHVIYFGPTMVSNHRLDPTRPVP